MREFKFRSWNGVYMDEVIGYDYNCGGVNKDIILVFDKNEGVTRYHTSDLDIMQYTGLKDINEKEIYEGDLLKIYSEFYKENIYLKVESEKCLFIASGINTFGDFERNELYELYDFIKKIEVVGNIYENKDLLNEI